MKTTGRKTVKGEKVSAPKAVKAASSKAVASATLVSAPTHDEIAKRSYELFLERGSVDGYASQDWIRAEAELKNR
jgi:hypothetical protein